jgi:peptidoglycan/xylan/chitin deacetylase (PgdA/CDA1 family)
MVRDEPSIELSPPEFERQLGESHELLSGFAPMRWFRPGSGHYDARMLKALDRRGYRCALGSVYPFDPQIRWSWFSKRFILGNVREGSIVILHDAGANGQRTLKTLRGVLPELKKRGFRVVTLSELEALRGAATLCVTD